MGECSLRAAQRVSLNSGMLLLDRKSTRSIALLPEETISASALALRGITSQTQIETITLWDVYNSRKTKTLPNKSHGFIDSVSFSPDGQLLASAGENNIIELWDIASEEKVNIVGHKDTYQEYLDVLKCRWTDTRFWWSGQYDKTVGYRHQKRN